jgi:hypothetical protein
MCVCMYVCVFMYVSMMDLFKKDKSDVNDVHTNAKSYTCMYMYIYIHTHTHIYIHTYTYSNSGAM